MEVSAEVHFAQTLASNEKKSRDRALKRLHKYIGVRSAYGEGLSHDDYIKIWKGLHYCMWMQDKPVIQEELSERMGSLLHAFSKLQDALKFVNVFFITEAREWGSIDRLRLDKFMMLIRQVLHNTFVLLSREGWPALACQSLAQYLTASIMNEDNPKLPFGLKSHLADIYLPEMHKVSLDGMNGRKLTLLLFPFVYLFVKSKRRDQVLMIFDKTVIRALSRHGHWSWQAGNRKRKKRELQVKAKKREKTQDVDPESGEESDDELEVGEESDSEEEEVMDVDEDGEKEERKIGKRKYDLSKLLRLMQCLGQRSAIDSRCRSAVYSFVKSYSCRDPSILSKDQSKKKITGHEAGFKEDSNDDDNDEDLDEATIMRLMGETERKKGNERKRRKLRRQENKEQEQGESNLLADTNNNVTLAESSLSVSTEQTVKQKRKKKKKKQQTSTDKDEKELATSDQTKSKKRKWVCSDRDIEVDSSEMKKSKLGDVDVFGAEPSRRNESARTMGPASLTTLKNKVKNKSAIKMSQLEAADDANSNARSSPSRNLPSKGSPKSKTTAPSFDSSIELVVYPQKSPPRASLGQIPLPVSKAAASPSRATPSPRRKEVAARGSPSPLTINLEKRVKPSQDEVKSESRSLTSSNEGSMVTTHGTLVDGFLSLIPNPGNLVNKAISLMVPAPGPSPSKDQAAAMPHQMPTTPGSQKKVVFDLRRNKANKFKDYIKSLATESPLPYQPSRSPSQGILKSPSTSSLSSSPVVQMGLKPSSSKTKAESPKATPSPKSPKGKKSPSPTVKRKTIKSPVLKRVH